AKVKISEDTTLSRLYPKRRPARVTVRLSSGSVLMEEQHHIFGDTEHPASLERWRQKCYELVDRETAANVLRFYDYSPASWSLDELLSALWKQPLRAGKEAR